MLRNKKTIAEVKQEVKDISKPGNKIEIENQKRNIAGDSKQPQSGYNIPTFEDAGIKKPFKDPASSTGYSMYLKDGSKTGCTGKGVSHNPHPDAAKDLF